MRCASKCNPTPSRGPSPFRQIFAERWQAARAKAAFEKLSYSHKKQFVDWIEEAKMEQTRTGRIRKSLEMLLAGKSVKG